ncbi:unnamed protein product [Closterium sp. Yama58-4]|nr:unnamed protein product [Closterium sp. Yama58-4]
MPRTRHRSTLISDVFNVRLSAMASGFVSAAAGRPPAPRMVTQSSGRRASPQREEDGASSSHRERSRSPRNGGNAAVTALELLNSARQPSVRASGVIADGTIRNGGNDRGPTGFHGEGRAPRATSEQLEHGENAPARPATAAQAQDRNDRGPAPADRNHRESARADRNQRDSARADRDRDSARAERERDSARADHENLRTERQNRDQARDDRRPDSANRRANQGEQQDPRNQQGIVEIADIIARLDPASQQHLRRIFAETAGERVTARSSASTERRTAEINSARYTQVNIGAEANNNEAIRHALGLLAALQRNNAGDPAPAPENSRPAAATAPRPRAPPPLNHERNDDDDRANAENLDEGNTVRLKLNPAPINLAPIPPARPQLRSSLVKSDGIRTQLFSFERIQAIAQHAISILPSHGGEQLGEYLQQIVDEAEEKIHLLFTADQRGFEVANMTLKIKYGEVVEDKNVKAATQIVAASKKRPHRSTTSSRPNPAPRNRGQGERHWTWRRDGDGRCFYCQEPGHGIADCPQRGQGANQPSKIV